MNESHEPRPREPRRMGLLYRLMMGFIGLFDRWLHLSCRSFVHLASEKHERPLRRGERLRQALHRAMCKTCRVQERRMDHLLEIAHELGRVPEDDARGDEGATSATSPEASSGETPVEDLSAEAQERIRRAMAETARGFGAPPTE